MTNVKTLRDVNLAKSKALPAAAATNYSDSIDTGGAQPGRIEGMSESDPELLIELPATPSLVDAKTVTLTLQDSADNVTFADQADIPAMVALGAGGAGAGAISRSFKFPVGLARYVRLKQAVLTAGGDNTAISSTLSIIV